MRKFIPKFQPKEHFVVMENEITSEAQRAQVFAEADRVVKSMQTPQSIRDLPVFDGNPAKLHSFIRAVENILPFMDTLQQTPFYNVWLQAIRCKITGEADAVLEIYGTTLNWEEIKSHLIAYYNDKRDVTTLTRELFQLQQYTTIEEFFGKVQRQLSLLINYTNVNVDNTQSRKDRTEIYIDNALNVFLAGLKEPIGSNVRARQPKTLKEAFDAAIEERNFQHRSGLGKPDFSRFSRTPEKTFFQPSRPFNTSFSSHPLPHPQPRNPYTQFATRLPPPPRNILPPRLHPKPQPKPIPMDIDRSIRSKQVNYMNRPGPSYPRPFHPAQRQYEQNRQRQYEQNRPFQPRQFFQQGPPRFHVEELTNIETIPYNYFENHPSYFEYANPDTQYYGNTFEQFDEANFENYCSDYEYPIDNTPQCTNPFRESNKIPAIEYETQTTEQVNENFRDSNQNQQET